MIEYTMFFIREIMKVHKQYSFEEFKNLLNKNLSVKFSNENVSDRKRVLTKEKRKIYDSEKSYISTPSHLKRQFSL